MKSNNNNDDDDEITAYFANSMHHIQRAFSILLSVLSQLKSFSMGFTPFFFLCLYLKRKRKPPHRTPSFNKTCTIRFNDVMVFNEKKRERKRKKKVNTRQQDFVGMILSGAQCN